MARPGPKKAKKVHLECPPGREERGDGRHSGDGAGTGGQQEGGMWQGQANSDSSDPDSSSRDGHASGGVRWWGEGEGWGQGRRGTSVGSGGRVGAEG